MKTEINIKDADALKLLVAYKNGNNDAFNTLYNMYSEKMLHYGQRITTDTELIKDCIQDIFCKLLDKDSKTNITHVGSYLFTSLRNRLLDKFRRSVYMSETAVEDMYIHEIVESVEKAYIVLETENRREKKVENLMGSLTSRQRQAFQLYYIEEREYSDICDIMEMNYHSVRNLVHRGMVKLRAAAV